MLRGSRGEAAGAELGSSFAERIAVNTGTVPVCPVTAIFALEDLPEKWQQFTAMNADWYNKK